MSKYSTAQVEDAIARRFSAPAFATFFNVKNRTGYGGQERFADAISLSLYPSRGLELHGFEVKASRSDWVKERDDPAKAEEIMRYCDRWWLAVGDADIVKPGELPPTWGLMVMRANGLVATTEAPKLKAFPLDRKFVAAILRRATEQTPEKITAAERREYERGHKVATDRAKAQMETMTRNGEHTIAEYAQLRQEVNAFEQASGLRVQEFQAAKIGHALRVVMADGFERHLDNLKNVLVTLADGVARAREALDNARGAQ